MAANYTANYNLCQWEATDQVLRTDFNQDNAKIDAALKELSLANSVPDLAFYLGQIGLIRKKEGKYVPLRDMICEAFLDSSQFTLSGGAVLQDNTVTLSGAQTGSLTTRSYLFMSRSWSRIWAWVHMSGGDAFLSVNGVPMSEIGSRLSSTVDGVSCLEREYSLDISGQDDSISVKLDLSAYTGSALQVFDFCVFLF